MSRWDKQTLLIPAQAGNPERQSRSLRFFALGPRLRGDERIMKLAFATFLMLLLAAPALAQNKGRSYGIGHLATPAEIAGWDIDVRPDGKAPRPATAR